MKLKALASMANLRLAWRRITTGSNQQYKRYYRDLYLAYEIASERHLTALRETLLAGAFEPSSPERVYLPKNSGLHRPLTLLNLEDQIVYQAFANISARRMYQKRKPLQLHAVFSNVLNEQASIFFFQKWQATYAAFQTRVGSHFRNGLRWVADFDLAAYYDTISHQLLFKTLYPKRSGDDDSKWFLDCLAKWSSVSSSVSHGHGLPQGPLASDFLAECFLLPIDLEMNGAGYLRYVDDIRLLGRTEEDVRQRVIELERRCRERGLIPQSGKFSIKRASTVDEAMGMLPSIGDPHHHEQGGDPLGAVESERMFRKSLRGRPLRIHDKTHARFALFRAPPNTPLLRRVLKLVDHQPEHSEPFFAFLSRFRPRSTILNHCVRLVERNPYAYVRGEAWHVLAAGIDNARVQPATRLQVLRLAERVTKKRDTQFVERLGACTLLNVSEHAGRVGHGKLLASQSPLAQAMLVASLPGSAFIPPATAVRAFLGASAFEPGLAVAVRLGSMPASVFEALDMAPTDLAPQTLATLQELGVVVGSPARSDPVGQLLGSRFGPLPSKSWKTLLHNEYSVAVGLMKTAEAAFLSNASAWLQNQNSLNQVVFMSLQERLRESGCSYAVTTRDKHGGIVKFGTMLQPQHQFSRNHPGIADAFREVNARRNYLPASHPYDEKTGRRTELLRAQQRNRFVGLLKKAYGEICVLF